MPLFRCGSAGSKVLSWHESAYGQHDPLFQKQSTLVKDVDHFNDDCGEN